MVCFVYPYHGENEMCGVAFIQGSDRISFEAFFRVENKFPLLSEFKSGCSFSQNKHTAKSRSSIHLLVE